MHSRLLFFVVTIVAFLALFITTPAQAAAANRLVTIGTAGVTGVYFPAGGAICRLVNIRRKENNIKCSVESTGGSIYNLNAIRSGEIDMGIVQSDWQFHASKGDGPFSATGKFDKLRSVFSLHSEPFTIVARADSGINNFSDLEGKRVNVGSPESGMRATMEEVMKAYGWTPKSFSLMSELEASEQGNALCNNEVDAIVFAAGHPNGTIQEITSSCPTKLIDVSGPQIDRLLKENPFYSYATIPGGMYKGNEQPTKTFGVKATLVTSSDLDPDLVYEIVKAVFDRFDDFKTLHPVFSTLNKTLMVFDGNTTPLHEGALRYYRETGLLKDAEKQGTSQPETVPQNASIAAPITDHNGQVSSTNTIVIPRKH